GRRVAVIEAQQIDLAAVDAAFIVDHGDIGRFRAADRAIGRGRPAIGHGLADLDLAGADAGRVLVLRQGGRCGERHRGKQQRRCHASLDHCLLPTFVVRDHCRSRLPGIVRLFAPPGNARLRGAGRDGAGRASLPDKNPGGDLMRAAAPARLPNADDAPITRELARRTAALRYDELPLDIRQWTRHCVLDWLGVTLAGAREELSQILAADAAEQGGTPMARLIGRDAIVPTQQAALVNGAASHALDYDDVNMTLGGHPTVAVLPALFALAEANGASGAALIAAFVAGYETLCRVSALVAPGHYARGYHTTATVGGFGAAAACANLLGLDAAGTATALGIAGTQAAGLKSMFGTMCKPLHAGKAAQNGLLAATLAARGFTSRAD